MRISLGVVCLKTHSMCVRSRHLIVDKKKKNQPFSNNIFYFLLFLFNFNYYFKRKLF